MTIGSLWRHRWLTFFVWFLQNGMAYDYFTDTFNFYSIKLVGIDGDTWWFNPFLKPSFTKQARRSIARWREPNILAAKTYDYAWFSCNLFVRSHSAELKGDTNYSIENYSLSKPRKTESQAFMISQAVINCLNAALESLIRTAYTLCEVSRTRIKFTTIVPSSLLFSITYIMRIVRWPKAATEAMLDG